MVLVDKPVAWAVRFSLKVVEPTRQLTQANQLAKRMFLFIANSTRQSIDDMMQLTNDSVDKLKVVIDPTNLNNNGWIT